MSLESDLRKQVASADREGVLSLLLTRNEAEPLLSKDIVTYLSSLRRLLLSFAEENDVEVELLSIQTIGVLTEIQVRCIVMPDLNRCPTCQRKFKSPQALGIHLHHGCKTDPPAT